MTRTIENERVEKKYTVVKMRIASCTFCFRLSALLCLCACGWVSPFVYKDRCVVHEDRRCVIRVWSGHNIFTVDHLKHFKNHFSSVCNSAYLISYWPLFINFTLIVHWILNCYLIIYVYLSLENIYLSVHSFLTKNMYVLPVMSHFPLFSGFVMISLIDLSSWSSYREIY